MSESPSNNRIDMVATASCLGALVFWGLGPLLMTYLTGKVDSWTQNALRYGVGAIFWLPVLGYSLRSGCFDQRTWRLALWPAAANLVMQMLWAESFYHIGPALAVLLSKTSVLWVAAFSLVFFHDERPLARSVRFWLGLVLSLAGLFGVLYFKDGFNAAGTVLGVALGLACAMMWAAYTLSVKIKLRDVDARSSFAVVSLYTAFGLWIAAWLFGKPTECTALGLKPWIAVVVSAITAISLAHVLYYMAIQRIGATIPALVVLSQPLLVFSVSSVVFHERFTPLQLLSGFVLLLGAGTSVWAQEHVKRNRA